jgi:hypothetical protein
VATRARTAAADRIEPCAHGEALNAICHATRAGITEQTNVH